MAPPTMTPMLQPRQPMMSSTGAAAGSTSAPSATTARPMMAPTGQSASSAMLKVGALPGGARSRVQQPRDAEALYALGEAYCAKNLKNICMSYMYMAISSAQSAGNASLVKQIKASLGTQ